MYAVQVGRTHHSTTLVSWKSRGRWKVENRESNKYILPGDDASCAESHGGVYNTNASDTWSTSTLGTWQLGMSSFGLQGKGDYAMENVSSSGNAEKRTQLGKQLVAAINAETDFYTGYFGLGINSANFKDTVAQSPINVLARQAGTIGSRSYGYTAGAYYGE